MKFEEATEIVYGLKPDYDTNDMYRDRLKAKRGPSRWGDPDLQFGPQEDYEFYFASDVGKWIYWPVSEAGYAWAYAKFPEDTPRFGPGFVIDNPRFARMVKLAAQRDKLMSVEEYEEAMNEADNLARQGDE